VAGEVTAVNTALTEKPESVNSDPHGSWMIEIRLSAAADLDALLNAVDYSALVT
jgi:glycine cleavage system H protein